MLAFLAARAVPATELVSAAGWQRIVAAAGVAGIVRVCDEPHRQALRVQMPPAFAGCEAEVLARVATMFDVSCDPLEVGEALGELAAADPGLRLPGTLDPFELVVRAIIGQQVTVAAARTLASRFVARFGMPLPAAGSPAVPAVLSHVFPSPGAIVAAGSGAVAEIGKLGIIRARAQAIVAVAGALCDGRLRLDAGTAVEPALAELMAIRGIGPWTAHYIAMRALGWRDAFPPGDVVVLKALRARTASEAARLAEAWRPWRAYAVLHLWRRMAVSAS
jgi:AraC family transcriptional regulator of adaptative response / DNA-3-methyladenine glycosylase II